MVKYQSPYNETITKLKLKTLWGKVGNEPSYAMST